VLSLAAIAKSLLEKRPMRNPDVPGLSWFLEEGEVPVYPYTKTFAEAQFEPFVAMHTSGTTGIPKAITTPHGAIAVIDAVQKIPALGGNPYMFSHLKGERLFSLFPLFHSGGLTILLFGVFAGYTVVFPPLKPPNADLVDRVHLHAKASASLIPPAIIVELASDVEKLNNLGRLKYLLTGGGPLPDIIGDLVSTRTHLCNAFGCSEAIIVPVELVDAEDWQYIKFSPFYSHEMRAYGDGLYELVALRREDREEFQGVFRMFPHLQEWASGDLFTKHPTKEGLWLFRGRSDDIVVYSTGEKFNPITMEGIITADPAVTGVLVCGQGHFQSSLLVEPKIHPSGQTDRERLLDEIWPSIRKANEGCSAFARVFREFVLFTEPKRPLPRNSKGGLQRRAAAQLYKQQLNDLYEREEKRTDASTISPVAGSWDKESLKQRILSIIRNVHGLEGATASTNLLDLGLDSLQVTTIARKTDSLVAKFGATSVRITNRIIYDNPSVNRLTEAVLGINRVSNATTGDPELPQHQMQKLYEHYIADLPITARPPTAPNDGRVVILTGSTGSLGSYILDRLLSDLRIRKIYCLNRSADGLSRQLGSQRSKGLRTDFPHERVRFLRYDMSAPYFGLAPPESSPSSTNRACDAAMYIELLRNVTDVIHNAWPVDFNLPLEGFAKAHLRGVRQMVDFSARSKYGAQVLFVSSAGIVLNHSTLFQGQGGASVEGHRALIPEIVPEAVASDPGASVAVGYTQSKCIAEHILAAAYKVANIPAIIVRVGQIAGPTLRPSLTPDGKAGDISAAAPGMWPKSEWFPRMLVSSANVIRKLPMELPGMDVVDWIPVDKCASVVVELILSASKEGAAVIGSGAMGETNCHPNRLEKRGEIPVYHAVNPRETTWLSLLPTVKAALRIDDTVPFTKWMDLLRQSARDPDEGGNGKTDIDNINDTAGKLIKGSGSSNDSASGIQGKDKDKSDAAGSDIALRNPALKLLEFFEDVESREQATYIQPRFALEQTLQRSETLASLGPVTPELMEIWLQQWGFPLRQTDMS
jgi:thioester reductase-like protein